MAVEFDVALKEIVDYKIGSETCFQKGGSSSAPFGLFVIATVLHFGRYWPGGEIRKILFLWLRSMPCFKIWSCLIWKINWS